MSADPTGTSVLRGALRPFGTSIFSTITEQAMKHGAINLAQGFPDFDPPDALVEAAHEAMRAGHHQYAPSVGLLSLRQGIAKHQSLDYDPDTEITVTVGATEAIVCTIQALTEPGDEVVLVEPCYDLYPPAVAAAGCRARYVTTRFPDFRIDEDELAAACGPKTRMIVVNTPWNPTGRALSEDELLAVGRVAERYDAYVLADEAYEHIVFDRHLPVASVPGCAGRTVTVSSISKTLSATGWRLGWAMAPAHLTAAIRQVHQFVTFDAVAPLQHAVSAMLAGSDDSYFLGLRKEYRERRDTLLGYLRRTDLEVLEPDGTYFVLGRCAGDDVEYCDELICTVGVAAIPASAFYADRAAGRGLVRFAFCKQLDTLHQAGQRLVRHGSE
ncbi:MAG: aminotransferase class I/II-fold pyridoxal phosphate-dependent enzyme [Actinocatenispora sp.]